MANLEYSNGAINVLNKFHDVDAMMYVEGGDDILFWEFMFEKFSEVSVKAEQVGGKTALKEYTQKVFEGKLSCIVAMDSDYSIFDNEIEHANILKTCGYSIENTLISGETIREVIHTLGLIPYRDISIDYCRNWLKKFEAEIEFLLLHDIKNHTRALGISVLGNNCDRFFKSKASSIICHNKISDHLQNITFDVSIEEKDDIHKKLLDNGMLINKVVRGHFLFSAVMRFISVTIKEIKSKISISNDALLGITILAFKSKFNNDHPHHTYYKNIVSNTSVV